MKFDLSKAVGFLAVGAIAYALAINNHPVACFFVVWFGIGSVASSKGFTP